MSIPVIYNVTRCSNGWNAGFILNNTFTTMQFMTIFIKRSSNLPTYFLFLKFVPSSTKSKGFNVCLTLEALKMYVVYNFNDFFSNNEAIKFKWNYTIGQNKK